MTYLNEKRRSLINSRPIIGTNHTVTSNTSSLVLPSPLDSAIEAIEIQGKTEQNGTPDKDTPVDIVSTGDNGLKVEVRGVNLWSSKRKYSQNLNYEIIDSSTVKIKANGSNIVPAYCFSIDIGGKGGGYKFSFDLKAKNTPDIATKNTISVYYSNSSSVSTGTLAAQKKMSFDTDTFAHNRFTVAIPEGYQYLGINFYGSTGPATFENYEAVLTNLQCTLTDDYIDFEPYFEPTGVSINTQLCGIDGYYDALTVDWSNSTVRKRAKIESINIKDCKIERLGVYNTKKFLMYYIDGVRPPLVNEARPFGWGLCTHGRWAEYNVYAEGLSEENLTISLYNGNIALYIPKSFGLPIVNEQSSYHTATVEALLEWIGDRDIIISYIAKDDNEEDLTDKLSSLFSLSTKKCSNNILEAQGASKITVTYYSNKYEDKLSLTVSYVDENGATVKGSDSYQVREGSLFSIIPPPISGYEPTVKRYDGCIKEKCEITITYKEKL